MKRKEFSKVLFFGFMFAFVFSMNAYCSGEIDDETINYSVLENFISSFPEHGRDEFALPGREEIHNENEMLIWLENHGWTNYVNLYADFGDPSLEDPFWAYEAQNGEWSLHGRSSIEWHEKIDDDYSDGCSVGIAIQVDFEDGYTVYEKCKDIVEDYFTWSYRDVEYDSTIWSGFFNEDAAARVYYNEGSEYNDASISIVFYDSIQPNLFGVFWNGIPLQIDGVIQDIPLTINTVG